MLLGDYVSESKRGRNRNPPEGTDGTELKIPANEIADALRGFKAKYGVYAVIGNHDWYHNGPKIHAELERVGINVLENEVEFIQVGDKTISLWGIEDFWKNRRVPTEPFDAIAEKRNVIAITHNPDSLLQTPSEIAIMFAGHSQADRSTFRSSDLRSVQRPAVYGWARVGRRKACLRRRAGSEQVSYPFRGESRPRSR